MIACQFFGEFVETIVCPPCKKKGRVADVPAHRCTQPTQSDRLCTLQPIAVHARTDGRRPLACSQCTLKQPIAAENCRHRGVRVDLGEPEVFECHSSHRRHHPVCTLDTAPTADALQLRVLGCHTCQLREA